MWCVDVCDISFIFSFQLKQFYLHSKYIHTLYERIAFLKRKFERVWIIWIQSWLNYVLFYSCCHYSSLCALVFHCMYRKTTSFSVLHLVIWKFTTRTKVIRSFQRFWSVEPMNKARDSILQWMWMKMVKKLLSEVGFEPTPSFEDQNAHFIEAKSISLESGDLDRSAILTLLERHYIRLNNYFSSKRYQGSVIYKRKYLR